MATRTASSWSSRRSLGRQARRRRLLDQLLMAALERAVALPERDDVARWRRRAAGPRCGEPGRSRAPGRPRRPRTRTRPRATRRQARPGSSAAEVTRRMPRPPPPAAALTSSGKPIRSASATIALDLVGPVDRGRLQRPGDGRDADGARRSPGMELVAEGIDRARGRPDEGEPGVLDRPARTPPARPGSRTRDGPPPRRCPARPGRSRRSGGSSRTARTARGGRRRSASRT